MKKHGILFLIIITTVSYNSVSQDFIETIEFADKQFENKNYQLAVKEYQRALFFSEGRRVDYLYKQIANAFFVNKQFDQAQYFYELSYKTSKCDSSKNEMLIKKVQCLLFLKRFRSSLFELYNLPDSSSDYFEDRKNFYLAISYFGLKDFKKSAQYFTKTVDNLQSKEEIIKLLNNKKLLYKPNPKTAKILSIILPGAGQLYAGDLKNSINSFALISGLIYLSIRLALKYSYLDAIITVIPWFMRYYQGGYINAEVMAKQKREKRRLKTFLKVLKIVETQSDISKK